MAGNVLVTCGHLLRNVSDFRPLFEKSGISLTTPELIKQQFDADEMLELLKGHDVLIAGDDFLTRKVLAAHKDSLKAVIKWGIGTDSIDKVAATELGMPVYNTPGAFSDEVGDLALGLLLAVARQIPQIHDKIRDSAWPRHEGMTLSGKTAGVVGLGGIGRATAKRAAAFGMDVMGYDPFPVSAAHDARQVELSEVLEHSDVLFLACELTADNRHMINANSLARCKDGMILVNVARGPLVDEAAVSDALTSGKIAAVALDVFETEPLPADSPLRNFPQNVFSSHSGSSTREAIAKINQMTSEMAIRVVKAEKMSGYNRVA